MDIIFLLSHIPDPRLNKRIDVADSIGETTIISWKRNVSEIWERNSRMNYIVIEPGSDYNGFATRIIETFKFASKALKNIKKIKPKCIYAGNLDMLAIAYFHSIFNKVEIMYEVADLNSMIIDDQKKITSKVIKKLLVILEEKLCKRINKIILTSEKFYESYYSEFIPENKVIYMPNIPKLEVFNNYKKTGNDIFTIGFIGGIRYIKQLKMLIDGVAEIGNMKVFIAGAGFNKSHELEFREYCKDMKFVEFYGKYDYDAEISSLYQKCDCIYSVYDANLKNVRMALPNKLYESIYCELPIIVAKNTYLSDEVKKMNVGLEVDHQDKSELVSALKKLRDDSEFYLSLVDSCRHYKEFINIKHYNAKLKNAFLQAIEKD